MHKINWRRVILGGLVAGAVMDGFELLFHRVILDRQWTAAFAALGKVPTGWTIFIPSNFIVGIVALWVYARIRPRYGAGPKTALLAGLVAWAIFCVIPTLAMMPLKLFPNELLWAVIGGGLIGASLATLVGASLYRAA